MASPRERVPEEDGEEHYEDVPSGEELEAPEDDPTAGLEQLPKLKLGGKGSSKGDKQKEQEEGQEEEETQSKKKSGIKSTTKQRVREWR
jgi:hypothetical protein